MQLMNTTSHDLPRPSLCHTHTVDVRDYLRYFINENIHKHTHTFNGPFSGTTRVIQYQKGKTNVDFTEARDSEWQWHQLGHMQVCTSLQTDNHTSTPPLSFLQAACPSCRPTNSVKALKAIRIRYKNCKLKQYSGSQPDATLHQSWSPEHIYTLFQ